MIEKLYERFTRLFADAKNTEVLVAQHAHLLRPLFWILIAAVAIAVIVFAIDIWLHPKVTASLGTFGDFFGGVLNPIFTFLTLFGLIVTIVIQRMELRLAREEYEKTAIALNTQATEATFFNALDLHHKIVDGLKFDPKIFPEDGLERMLRSAGKELAHRKPVEGRNVFGAILVELGKLDRGVIETHERYKFMQDNHNHVLGHYFRNLYQALKVVDNYSDQLLTKRDKEKYAGILRAQLSSNELTVLFLNCLDGMVDDGQFKNLLIRYRMLEHLPLSLENGIYCAAGTKLPLATDEIIRQYIRESEQPSTKSVSPDGRGAFGRNPIVLP